MPIFIGDANLMPNIPIEVLITYRTLYGVLVLGLLVLALPNRQRFFTSEKWQGYTIGSTFENLVQNPISSALLIAVWSLAALGLISGKLPLLAAMINLLFCRYFFVSLRWKSSLRGMGAPGFMTYWMSAGIFLLELCYTAAPSQISLAVLTLQIDFAFIIMSSGIYKFTAGYAQNVGMQYGMMNPEWGYWWTFYKKLSVENVIFKFLNHMAWFLQIFSAILMLTPQCRLLGALIMLGSFIGIRTQIRLGVLCEMVMLCCFIFFHQGSFAAELVSKIVAILPLRLPVLKDDSFAVLVHNALLAYLILLPLAHAGLFFNFYGKKRLPGALQTALEKYTNFFGIIIWRVFTADVVNFFILIYHRNLETGKRTLISRYGWKNGLRFSHVGESIAITSLFTTLKYYASNPQLFKERLLRYSKTLPCPQGHVLDFDYVSIQPKDNKFTFKKVARYEVDPQTKQTTEFLFKDGKLAKTKSEYSPIHEGIIPGSYAPAKK